MDWEEKILALYSSFSEEKRSEEIFSDCMSVNEMFDVKSATGCRNGVYS